MRLTDAMAFAEGQRGHDLGYDAPHELLRRRGGLGRGRAASGARAAPEFGLYRPLIRLLDDGGPHLRRHDPAATARRRAASRSTTARPCGRRSRVPRATASASRCAGRRSRRSHAPEPTASGRRGSPDRRHRRGAGAPGRPSTTSTRARTASSCAQLGACSEGPHLPAHGRDRRRARRPRSPRPSAASATGTTATPGSATRA